MLSRLIYRARARAFERELRELRELKSKNINAGLCHIFDFLRVLWTGKRFVFTSNRDLRLKTVLK